MRHDISDKFAGISPSPTLTIDAMYKEMLAQGADVVGFGAGEPDFDTPDHIKEAAVKAIWDGFTKYTPASGTLALKKAICQKLERENGLFYEPSQIVVSNGAKHSLVNAFGAILNPGDEVIIPAPFWVSYTEMVKLADGVPVLLQTGEENGFKFTVSELEKAITPKTVAILINSPSNPTGAVCDRQLLEEVAALAVRENLYIVSDEVYEHLVYGGAEHVSVASFGEEIKERTIIVNGLSKTFSMTGWRIGYTASNAKVAKAMADVQSHATSNPNSIAQAAGVAALTGPMDCVRAMREEFDKRRLYMVSRINSIEGVSCVEPEGAFYVMMNIKKLLGREFAGKTINSCDEFAAQLLNAANVALVPGGGFGAPGYLRWSYATSMEKIKEGLDRLEAFIKES